MMMILGMFVFSVPTVAYQTLQRSTTWRHASNARVGDAPASQFVGNGDDTITLEGSIVPEFGSQMSLTALRLLGNTGKSYPLIAGDGKIYGLWRLDSVDETQTYHFKNGLARKVEFSLKLTKTTSAGTLISHTVNSVIGRILQ